MAAKMIKIPGIGPVKPMYLYAGIGITVGILAVAYWRRSQATPAEDAGTAAAADELVTDPYAQGSDAAGYNTVYPPQGGYAPYGYDMYGNPIPPPVSPGSGGAYTTNRDWAAAATEILVDGGTTSATASTAISAVLGGLSVTSAQRGMFLRAVGVLGEPPQGYPKPIHLTDTPAQPKPPAARPPGKTLKAPTGLRASSTGQTSVTLDWNAVSGAAGYAVYGVHDPSGGGTPAGKRLMTVTYSGTTVRGLRKRTRYRFDIHPVGFDGNIGGRARTYATTKK